MTLRVAVLGATGTVGQRFVRHLAAHPWFELVHLAASERSAGRRYGEAVRWIESTPCPEAVQDLVVHTPEPHNGIPIVFSALDTATAGPVEEAWRAAGTLVVSNASAHRMDEDVPLLVPEVNGDQGAELCRGQVEAHSGAIVCQPNCSTTGLVLALAPLVDTVGIDRVDVVSLQAASGAGFTGPTLLELADNVIPHISGEADKLARETPRVLGHLMDGRVRPRDLPVEATCTRVPVLDGHLLCLTLDLARECGAGELRELLATWQGHPDVATLPSAPPHPLLFHDAPDAPQPRLCRDLGGGMSVSLGGLTGTGRRWRLKALVHNTERGAAKGALLTAELALRGEWLTGLRAPSLP